MAKENKEIKETKKTKEEQAATNVKDVKEKNTQAKEQKQTKETKQNIKTEDNVAKKPKKEQITEGSASKNYISRLKKKYYTEIRSNLMKELKCKSIMEVPKIEKVVINCGVGDAIQDKNAVDAVVEEISLIAGQRAIKTYAKKSISNFHLRAGMPIGVKVTLRNNRMYDFIDKLINIALPRVRDFKGLNPNSFDGRGNYSLALKEQLVFPEIDYDKIKKIRGMDITVVTTAKNDKDALLLLKKIGFPFEEK